MDRDPACMIQTEFMDILIIAPSKQGPHAVLYRSAMQDFGNSACSVEPPRDPMKPGGRPHQTCWQLAARGSAEAALHRLGGATPGAAPAAGGAMNTRCAPKKAGTAACAAAAAPTSAAPAAGTLAGVPSPPSGASPPPPEPCPGANSCSSCWPGASPAGSSPAAGPGDWASAGRTAAPAEGGAAAWPAPAAPSALRAPCMQAQACSSPCHWAAWPHLPARQHGRASCPHVDAWDHCCPTARH